MDNLTPSELSKAPAEILWLYSMAHAGYPVGYQTYKTISEQYPEYFTETIIFQATYESIPLEVHQAYETDREACDRYYDSEMPISKGLFYWCSHPEELQEWESKVLPISQKRKQDQQQIWDKHYAKFDLKRKW